MIVLVEDTQKRKVTEGFAPTRRGFQAKPLAPYHVDKVYQQRSSWYLFADFPSLKKKVPNSQAPGSFPLASVSLLFTLKPFANSSDLLILLIYPLHHSFFSLTFLSFFTYRKSKNSHFFSYHTTFLLLLLSINYAFTMSLFRHIHHICFICSDKLFQCDVYIAFLLHLYTLDKILLYYILKPVWT